MVLTEVENPTQHHQSRAKGSLVEDVDTTNGFSHRQNARRKSKKDRRPATSHLACVLVIQRNLLGGEWKEQHDLIL